MVLYPSIWAPSNGGEDLAERGAAALDGQNQTDIRGGSFAVFRFGSFVDPPKPYEKPKNGARVPSGDGGVTGDQAASRIGDASPTGGGLPCRRGVR